MTMQLPERSTDLPDQFDRKREPRSVKTKAMHQHQGLHLLPEAMRSVVMVVGSPCHGIVHAVGHHLQCDGLTQRVRDAIVLHNQSNPHISISDTGAQRPVSRAFPTYIDTELL
jgi:hypothetical protein